MATDMVLIMAIEDYAKKEGITQEESRDLFLSSEAAQLLYDSSNGIWGEGPDGFMELFENISARKNANN